MGEGYSAARGRGERGHEKAERVQEKKSRDRGRVPPSCSPFFLGLVNFQHRLEVGRGKKWSAGPFGPEQDRPAQGKRARSCHHGQQA